MIDILTIGDSAIDLYMKIGDQGVSEGSGQICFFHGSKILVDEMEDSIAGNSVNVAVGCSKLDLKTAIYTELGDDDNGNRVVEELKEKRIDTRFCNTNPGIKTNVHAVVVHGDDRTIFSHHGKLEYKIQKWKKPKWIYYTSLGHGFETFQEELVNYIKQNPEIGVAYNPGSIQMKAGVEKMKNILEVAHVVLVNKEEAIRITKSDKKAYIELHKELHKLGPKLSVITDGSRGANAYDGDDFVHVDIITDQRPLVDKTGAGDAFSSAFISAIVHKRPLEEALKWGAINSGCVIKEIGAINGLCDQKELMRILQTSDTSSNKT